MKKIFSLLLVLLVLGAFPMPASAHDYVQMDRTDCSIEVIVQYKDTPINSGSLTAVRVGYVTEDDGNYFFCQEITDKVLKEVSSAAMASDMLRFYEKNRQNGALYTQTANIRNGLAKFENLPTGLYLICQEKASSGYSKMNAFLVSVPYMVDGTYQYQVTANAKSALEREPVPTEPTGEKLPQTGQLNWPVPVLAASGLILIAAGCILTFGRKKDAYEK